MDLDSCISNIINDFLSYPGPLEKIESGFFSTEETVVESAGLIFKSEDRCLGLPIIDIKCEDLADYYYNEENKPYNYY